MNAHLPRAQLLLQQQRYDMAEAELRQAIGAEPDDAAAHALLGLSLTRQNKNREAVEACRRAVSLGPDIPFCHYAMAGVLYEQERHDEALAAVAEAIRLDPYEASYHALRGQIHLHKRNWKDALAAAEDALAVDAESVDGANVRAVALTNLGRRAEAGATIDAALARDPDNATTHANQGWTLLHANRPKEAMSHFAEALRLDPNLEWARAGIVEAMKARNPIYRVMLGYFLWISRLSSGVQFGLLVGAYVLVRFLRHLQQENPNLAPYIIPIVIAYVVFVFVSWTADPLFNLVLRLNRFGRRALSQDQRIASNWFGATLLLAVAFGLAALARPAPGTIYGFAFFAAMTIPVAGVFKVHDARRPWFVAYVVVMACFGLATLANALVLHTAGEAWDFNSSDGRWSITTTQNETDWGLYTSFVFLVMWIAFMWLANIFSGE